MNICMFTLRSSDNSSKVRLLGPADSRKAQNSLAVNIFQVNHHDSRKPMTLEEAMLEMEQGSDYVVYRDAEKEKVSVLVRRRDGHFDLIEG